MYIISQIKYKNIDGVDMYIDAMSYQIVEFY